MLRTKAQQMVTGVVIVALGLLSAAPQEASAATYRPQTEQELIAYVYGQLLQLQALLNAWRTGEFTDYSTVVVRGSSDYNIDVTTLTPRDVTDEDADLRGEVDLDTARSVEVWFEYGQDDDLDDRTSKRTLYDSRGDEQTFTINIDDLDADERYYFRAVAEDPDGDREYGAIKSFYTDDRGSSDDFVLELSDRTIDEGDSVKVDWEVPRDETGNQNWIGMYEPGDGDKEYILWKYIADDTDGTVEFTIYNAGEYEFRLFLDNSYDEEVTSDTLEVE
ncbi:MAG: hypothetical protein KC877_03315 [Candidatus Kaiserbacteria bacterium]|nr:hypothetical protein [Candidatus Kaiserbacteria bacterium]MCB9816118.1 hypothetical protein [Candidatus Nomurabacteria bacterium]